MDRMTTVRMINTGTIDPLDPLKIFDYKAIYGIPTEGRGYQVVEVSPDFDLWSDEPKLKVIMSAGAFREAIGHLNDPSGYCRPLFKERKPSVKKVIFNPPATIVWFSDEDKVISKVDGEDEYSWEAGLAICILKKRMDRKEYNRLHPYFFEGERPLWDVLVRMNCPNGEWEKIKKMNKPVSEGI